MWHPDGVRRVIVVYIVLSSSLFFGEDHPVIHVALPFRDVAQFALKQHFAERGDAVDVHMAFQMVILMLDDSGFDTGKLFLVLHEVLVKVTQADAVGADHLFIDARKAEATLLERHIVTKSLHQMRINKDTLEVFCIRVIGI